MPHVSRRRCRPALIQSLESRRLLSDTPIYIDPPPFGRSPGGDHQASPSDRWWSTATNGSTGAVGNPITLTWGFIADGVSIPASGSIDTEVTAPSILQARLNSLYGNSSVWQPIFQSVFDRWSAVSGITYVYTGLNDDGAAWGSNGVLGVRPDIRIGGHYLDGTSDVLAYNYFPTFGDMVIDTADLAAGGYMFNTTSSSRRLRNVVAHEHGHGLGLEHVDPINGTKLMEAFVYTGFDGPQFDDILGVQSLYGDVFEKNGRNETAATAHDFGTLSLGSNLNLTPWTSTPVSIANLNDSDYYKFTVTDPRNVTLTLNPFGPTYNQGPQGGSTSSFNASAQGNLALTLYGTNGTTVLANANANGLGGAETTGVVYLPAGTYYVKVNTTAGSTQAYQLLATSASTAVIDPPSTPQLLASSDTGISDSDGLTNDTTPTFTGTGPAGATITLLDNGTTPIGTGLAGGDGVWTIAASFLSDGAHSITANATVGSGTGPASDPAVVTIDTVGPAVTATLYDRLGTQDVRITFNGAFYDDLLAPGFEWRNITTDTVIPIDRILVSGTGDTVANVQVDPLLPTGNYRLSIPPAGITDAAGNGLAAPFTFTFRQLNGDANNDGTVNFTDLLLVAQYYGQTGRTYGQGNFNYSPDGLVSFEDLLILAQNYGQSLTLPPAAVAAPAVDAKSSAAGARKRGEIAADLLA